MAAVLRVLNVAEVVIATAPEPTSVLPVPPETVTAPTAEPVLTMLQSKDWLIKRKPPKIPASVNVPVGKVNATAVALLVVIIPVNN